MLTKHFCFTIAQPTFRSAIHTSHAIAVFVYQQLPCSMAPAKKAPALFAQLQKTIESEGEELASKVKVRCIKC